MQKGRLVELDALRGCAALIVILYHYFYRYDQIYGHDSLPISWFAYGHYGVQLFFIISGFVIYWSINRAKKPTDFIVSRFSRLYPVYWAALIITFFAVNIWGLEGREVSSVVALMNILMFQEYFNFSHIDGVYWTLTVELTFYFWIFSLSLFSLLKKVEYILVPFILLSIFHYAEVINLPDLLVEIFILKYLPFFVVGICFYKIANNLHDKLTVPIILFCLIASGFSHGLAKVGLFAGFFIVFYMAIIGKLTFLRSRGLVYLGTISYPLYLIHQNIGYIIINKFYQYNLPASLGIFTAILLSILIAILLMKYIEQPLLGHIRTIYKKPRVQYFANKITYIR
jgi:peptidoglycan/LPS O-acetylase OafA/YrhL